MPWQSTVNDSEQMEQTLQRYLQNNQDLSLDFVGHSRRTFSVNKRGQRSFCKARNQLPEYLFMFTNDKDRSSLRQTM